MTDAKPKNWSRTCEAAKWLRKDLYEGNIDPHRDQAHVIQENCPLYLYYTKEISQQNYKKTIIEQPDQDNILFNNIIFHDSNSAAEEILKSYLH